jgi:hypothetical protein
LPTITGANNNVALNFAMTAQSMSVSYLETAYATLSLAASPVSVNPGAATVLTWNSANSTTCATSGAWSGSLAGSGSRSAAVGGAGAYNFTLDCQNRSGTSSTTAVSVQAK